MTRGQGVSTNTSPALCRRRAVLRPQQRPDEPVEGEQEQHGASYPPEPAAERERPGSEHHADDPEPDASYHVEAVEKAINAAALRPGTAEIRMQKPMQHPAYHARRVVPGVSNSPLAQGSFRNTGPGECRRPGLCACGDRVEVPIAWDAF
jgi:hypothetical protein